MIDSKQKKVIVVAIMEVLTAILSIAFFVINQRYTEKLGKEYDEANLTASDYNIQVDVRARHR